jgi:hypothetical protein
MDCLECDDQSEWVNATQYYKCPMCGGSGKAPMTKILSDAYDLLQEAVMDGISWAWKEKASRLMFEIDKQEQGVDVHEG